jgi:hypothetical protein
MKVETGRKLLRLYEQVDKLLGESNYRVSKLQESEIRDNTDQLRLAMEQDRADLLADLGKKIEEIILASMNG